jgi:hypothetical protein
MIKKALATTTVAVLLMGAAATAAGAASDGPDTSTDPAPAVSANGARGHHLVRRAIRLSVKTAADTIGVQPAALRDAVRGGQTIGEFAQSKGVDPGDVEQAIVDALTARIDQAVKDGKVPEERAAKVKERLSTFAHRVVTSHPKARAAAPASAG